MIIRVTQKDIDSGDNSPYYHPIAKAIKRCTQMDAVVFEDTNGVFVVKFNKHKGCPSYKLPQAAWKFYQDYMFDELEPDKQKPKPFSFEIEL